MLRICILLCLLPSFLLAQKSNQQSILINTEVSKPSNFFLSQNFYKGNSNQFKDIRDYISSFSLIKGYKYKFDLKALNQIAPLYYLKNTLPIQNFSFLDTNLFNTYKSDLNIKGSVNVNGITNLMTLKGNMNKYNGNYFLQLSYHISSNNTSYIPKIVNEHYQKGFALIFKMNLERGH